MCGAVVKDQFSLTANSEGASSNPGKAVLLKFGNFLNSFWIIFPLRLFPFIITADPLELREDFVVMYFQFIFNPFAFGDFAEKCLLKLVEWFSDHCRAVKS